ncbi:hypothetical protein V6N12_058332 [Hibiscus sabdariffa]|uniref:RNase H type-1 domain-containing protein n=1 Tax=Hibiscus sabdariffa TaxID=183260 RepID=A0ABR2ERW1_9ROSI
MRGRASLKGYKLSNQVSAEKCGPDPTLSHSAHEGRATNMGDATPQAFTAQSQAITGSKDYNRKKGKQRRFGRLLSSFTHYPRICNLCEAEVETVIHSFKYYSGAKEILSLGEIPASIRNSGVSSIKVWLEEATDSLTETGFAGFILLLWGIWNRRNDKVFDNTLSDAKGVVDRISALHYEFCMAHARTDNGHHPSQSHTFCKKIKGHKLDSLVEVAAFLKGIHLAIRRGWSDATIESGVINVVNGLANPSMELSTLGVQLQPARDIINRFNGLRFLYVNWLGNVVAHELAKWALQNDNDIEFGLNPPRMIHDMIFIDLLHN